VHVVAVVELYAIQLALLSISKKTTIQITISVRKLLLHTLLRVIQRARFDCNVIALVAIDQPKDQLAQNIVSAQQILHLAQLLLTLAQQILPLTQMRKTAGENLTNGSTAPFLHEKKEDSHNHKKQPTNTKENWRGSNFNLQYFKGGGLSPFLGTLCRGAQIPC
jgi:hypothetical protein